MKITSLGPEAGELEVDGFEGLRDHFARRYWAAPSLLLNLVSNTRGEFVGENQSSRDISNEIDYQALIGYRMAADVILTTAGTARAESYRRSKFAPLALVSKSADFTGIPAVEQETAGPTESRVFLLVRWTQVYRVARKYRQSWISVRAIGTGSAFGLRLTLSQLGWRRVLVEAGPKFANWLLVRNCIRGLALSIVGYNGQSPTDAAAAALANLGIQDARLESADLVETTLLTRWTNLVARPV